MPVIITVCKSHLGCPSLYSIPHVYNKNFLKSSSLQNWLVCTVLKCQTCVLVWISVTTSISASLVFPHASGEFPTSCAFVEPSHVSKPAVSNYTHHKLSIFRAGLLIMKCETWYQVWVGVFGAGDHQLPWADAQVHWKHPEHPCQYQKQPICLGTQ